jgi:hypothetical protein
MADSIYKDINPATDVLNVQRVVKEDLYNTRKFQSIPFTSGNNYDIVTSSVPSTDTDYYNKITFVNKSGSSTTYFSYINAESSSYSDSSGSAMSYWNFKNMLYPNSSGYLVDDGTYSGTSEEMTIISVNREFYRDGIDGRYFGVLLNTGSSASISSSVSNNEFDGDSDIVTLVADMSNEKNSRLGTKYFLYPLSSSVASSTVIYDSDTDEYTHETDMDKTKPYGELLVEQGTIVLYRDIIKTDHALLNDTDPLDFVAGFGGRSFMQLNGTIYSSNLKLKEHNFTTNPTFFEENSQEIIKEDFRENPVVYITGIGLYNQKNECIAFGRPSKPLKKSFSDELVFKIELNY